MIPGPGTIIGNHNLGTITLGSSQLENSIHYNACRNIPLPVHIRSHVRRTHCKRCVAWFVHYAMSTATTKLWNPIIIHMDIGHTHVLIFSCLPLIILLTENLKELETESYTWKDWFLGKKPKQNKFVWAQVFRLYSEMFLIDYA